MRWLLGIAILGWAGVAAALEPREVVILVNQNEHRSKEVAEYYAKRRGVPTENIITLDIVRSEDISRADYDERIVTPLRRELASRRGKIKVLLSSYGMPLRVGPLPMSEQDQKDSAEVRRELAKLHEDLRVARDVVKDLEETVKQIDIPSLKERLDKRRAEIPPIEAKIKELETKDRRLRHVQSEAALDSELMQLWWDDYTKEHWIVNPLYFQIPDVLRRRSPPMLMTSRLDGPSGDIAKRLVDDAIEVEAKGLEGIACIDARNIKYEAQHDQAGAQYGGYDESMREAAALLRQGKMIVRLDDKETLLPPGSCPDCALYCGWYSLNQYVPCCQFNKGAVAWHLASMEAVSLRNPKTQWCGNILESGAAATLGPVAEPYTAGFPRPAEFFGFLATGEFTLVEAYSRSLMFSSWMMTLVGDPLYNPYKKTPLIKLSDVQPSPKGSKFIFGQPAR